MIELQDDLKNLIYDNTKVGDKAPTVRSLSDVVNATHQTLDEYNKKRENQFVYTAPEAENSTGVRIRSGISDGLRQMMYTPEGVEIFAGQAVMSIGDWTGSNKNVERGKALIQSANLALDMKIKELEKNKVQLGSKDYESFSYSLGNGAANYGVMLAASYLTGGSATVGIAAGATMELTGEVQEGVEKYKEKTGDKELKNIDTDWAKKEFGTTSLYTAVSTIMEKKIGFGEQMKLFKQPLKSHAKQILLNAASEGFTEFAQNLANMGIDLADGSISWDEMPDQLRQAFMEGAVGAVLGGAAGTASAINHRSQAKAILRENLKNTVPAKDLEVVVDALFDSAQDNINNTITQELTNSVELQAKHGAIYDSLVSVINQTIETSGALANTEESIRAQYVSETASLFADQVLAQANLRKVAIDDVIKASDIVFEDGGIKFKVDNAKLDEPKRARKKKMEATAPVEDTGNVVTPATETQNQIETVAELPIGNGEQDGELYQLAKESLDIAKQNEELDKVNPEYTGETININGVEKTVYNSDGTRIAKSAEALQNFYKWFGDSKVVDEQGRPLVVYHGSPSKNIETFDKSKIGARDYGYFGQGFSFTPQEWVAEGYSRTDEENPSFSNQNIQGKVYPVYLKLNKPKYVTSIDEGNINTEKLKKKGFDGVVVWSFNEYSESVRENDPDVKQEIEDAKKFTNKWWQVKNYFDEVVGKKIIDEIVVFDPNQIKSVSNRGTFSKDNDNIYYQFAGEKATTIEKGDTFIELEGNEITSFEIDGKPNATIQEKAKEWFRKNFAGKPLENTIIGKVEFYNRQGGETVNNNWSTPENLRYLPSVREIIAKATSYTEEAPKHEHASNIVKFYRFEDVVKLGDEKPRKVIVKVAEDTNGKKYYTMDARGDKKTPAEVSDVINQAAAGDTLIVSDINDNVKQNVKGSFNQNKKLVKLFESADFSTLPHELAHFWLDNMWTYSRNEKASPEFKKTFNGIAKWLGVRSNQTYLSDAQHEAFARSYEQYLLNGDVPDPILKNGFESYDRWLKQVYNDMNVPGSKLTKQAKKFFDSMTTGELPPLNTVPSKEEEEKEYAEEVKQHTKVVEKITNPTPIAPTQSTITTGETAKSAVYTREIDNARKDNQLQAEFPDLEYNKVKLEEQRQKAVDYVASNLLDAREVVYGRKSAPEGLLDTAIRIAYEEAMLSQGNISEYVRALKAHSSAQTIRGQEISAERIARDDMSTPKFWHDKLSMNRRAMVADKVIGVSKDAISGNAVKQLNALISSKAKELAKEVAKAKTPAEKQKIMKEFAKKIRQEYNLPASEELYQTDAITADNANLEMLSFMESVFGVSVSENEMSEIVSSVDNIQKSINKTQDKTGNPSIETLTAIENLNKSIEAKTPSSVVAISTSIVARAMMLASVKSPVLNIVSNAETLGTEALTHRIVMKLQGKDTTNLVDKAARDDYLRYCLDAYVASGYNITTTTDSNFETKVRGEDILTTQGEGKFRKGAQWIETGIFKYSMGLPDSVSKDMAFVDYVSLEASAMAKGDKAKATEIFKDACLIEPKTAEGQELRKRGQTYAHKATFTDDNIASTLALSIREALNHIGSKKNGLRLGDQLMPFVKTPASVLYIGGEYAAGILYAIPNIQTIIKDVKSGNISEKTQNAITSVVRNGVGMVLAALLSFLFDPEDYIPEYEALSPSERELIKNENGVYNALKIGDHYFSLDYLGPIGVAMAGMLSARREKSLGSYASSVGSQALKIPGIKEFKDAFEKYNDFTKQNSEKNLDDLKEMSANYVMSRTIPALVSDFAKVFDGYERDTNKSITNVFKSKIPGLRNTLDKKYSSISGEAIKSNGPLTTLFFGGRIKPAIENEISTEFNRLFTAGERPALTDVTRYGKLKDLDGDIKPEVRAKFAEQYSAEVDRLIRSPQYMRADDDDKKNMINKVRKNVVAKIKREYGIR